MVIKKGRLTNGLQWLIDKPYIRGMGVSSVIITLDVGAIDERPEQRGLTHFIEHLMFHSKKKNGEESGGNRLVDAFNILGTINASTSADVTSYFITVPTSKLADAIRLLIQIVFQSHITTKDIEEERNVVLEEYKSGHNNGASIVEDVQDDVFKGHPLSNPVIAGATYIHKYNLDMIRKYVNRFYSPQNSLMVVCSEEPVDKIKEVLADCFSGGGGAGAVGPLHYLTGDAAALAGRISPGGPFVVPVGGEPRMRTWKGKQTAICIGLSIAQPMNDLRRYVTHKLLSYILGGSNMSEMFRRLRLESNLVYSIECTYNEYKDVGILQTFCLVDMSNINKVIAQIKEVLAACIDPKRFVIYKKNFVHYMKLELGTSVAAWTAFQSSRWYLSSIAPSYAEVVETANGIGWEDVVRAAKEGIVFDKRMVIGVKRS